MKENEAVYRHLMQIQRRHSKYFIESHTNVFDSVQIVCTPLTLFVLDHNMPPEIRAEIEDIVNVV